MVVLEHSAMIMWTNPPVSPFRMSKPRRSGRIAGASTSEEPQTTPSDGHPETGSSHEARTDAMLALMQSMLQAQMEQTALMRQERESQRDRVDDQG